MKHVALALAAFALAGSVYSAIIVVPEHVRAGDKWMEFAGQAGRYPSAVQDTAYRALEQEYNRLRDRSQYYAFGIIGTGGVGLILALIALRKKPRGQAIAATVIAGVSLAVVGFLIAVSNIF